jgi:hypothetical protein
MDWFGVKRVLAVTSAELKAMASELRAQAHEYDDGVADGFARSLEDKALVLSTLDAVIAGGGRIRDPQQDGPGPGFLANMPGMSPAERVQQLEEAEPEPEEDSPEARGEGLLRQMRRTSPPEE